MDKTERKITKIAREVNKFTVQMMKEDGIGTAEFDLIHLVRHNAGITQKEVVDTLKIDKGAAARRILALEKKGYIVRKENPNDGRSNLLYATDKADSLKNSKVEIESFFYQWLLNNLSEKEVDTFCLTLDKLYNTCKSESRKNFINIKEIINNKRDDINE